MIIFELVQTLHQAHPSCIEGDEDSVITLKTDATRLRTWLLASLKSLLATDMQD